MRSFLLLFSLGFALAPACDGEDSGSEPLPQWYLTCGDPVCGGYSGPFDGVPLCADEGVSVGDACTTADLGTECDPVDACNARLRCAEEDPTQQPGGCPISKVEHKEQVAYLTPEQRAEAARQALDLKLAQWRYRGGLDDGKEHVGFLIDDVGESPAVRPDGEHVDLYGYTSLAVAALQEQQARIEALEARLVELEARCKP